jgi:hypothetical protein
MKNFGKICLVLISLAAFGQLTKAQSVTIQGTVSNTGGRHLNNVFVRDVQSKTGIYTDTTGSFTIVVNPGSRLYINCAGYNDTTLNIGKRLIFNIVLTRAFGVIAKPIKAREDFAPSIVQNMFRDQLNLEMASIPQGADIPSTGISNGGHRPHPAFDAQQGAIFPVFTVKEETRGSRYLFLEWAKGFVINSKDSLIQRSDMMFNYDKMGGGLLLSRDGRSAIEVNREQVKTFTLYSPDGVQYNFENVPAISKKCYVEVVEEGTKYKIYKLVNTEFVKMDYATNGLTTSGNPYDEYLDKPTYYVIGKDGAPLQIALKRKALKEAFKEDTEKLNQFFASNGGDIDDDYLRGLGEYMNK